jgi:hypothetical protein
MDGRLTLEFKPSIAALVLNFHVLNLSCIACLLPEKKGVEQLWSHVGNTYTRHLGRMLGNLRIAHHGAKAVNRVETHFLLLVPFVGGRRGFNFISIYNRMNTSKEDLKDVWDVKPIQTQHYKFYLEYIATVHPKKVYDTGHLFVGNLNNPCLSITFNLPGIRTINDRLANIDLSIASLNKIKNIKECILEDSKSPGSSFSKEMLNAVMDEIRTSFSFVRYLKLHDTSYIPCDGDYDTLDLLFYNIALYKKTWYEQSFNAYFIPRDDYIKYKCAIENYASPETKNSYSWEGFYTKVFSTINAYAKSIIRIHNDEIELMYESAKTFPDFFIALSNFIPRSDKCKFFKDWLEMFLKDDMKIKNERTWYIDLYPLEKSILSGGRRIRATRRKKLRHRRQSARNTASAY